MANIPDTTKYDETGAPPPVPPGNYIVTVHEIKQTNKDGIAFTDKNGDAYELVFFSVKGHDTKLLEKIYIDENGDVPTDGPYAEQRLGRLKQIILALGLDTQSQSSGNWLGKVCRAQVMIKDYKGKQYNNILKFEPLNDGESFEETPEADEDLPF